MRTSEVLNRAADLIEERGWVKGSFGWQMTPTDASPLCLEGGILAACGSDFRTVSLLHFWTSAPYVAVQEYLDLAPGRDDEGPIDPLWRWNDDSSTAEEVIATLRAVAVIEAAREEAAERVAVSA